MACAAADLEGGSRGPDLPFLKTFYDFLVHFVVRLLFSKLEKIPESAPDMISPCCPLSL